MNVASPETISANLRAPVRLTGEEPPATITQMGTKFQVETNDAPGGPKTFLVRYTFGFSPLQQYLVEGERGRLQPLRLAWDSRPKKEGGQHWLQLYGGQKIPPGDPLHWSGPNQNYNGMCADCHSTQLRRGYQATADTFETTWSEINVSCEACHGAASAHLAWTKLPADARGNSKGFSRPLTGGSLGSWVISDASGIARPVGGRPTTNEIDACAPCHSRRTLLREEPGPPDVLLDLLTPELALAPLYHLDGQVNDEDYVWGSFTQSKMHHAGVTCSNCHDPHAGSLRAEGNALCAQCHSPDKFDVEAHHHHPSGPGAQCVNCHMPEKTYMEVDSRRDHSFRIPQPQLTVAFGTPNVCSDCHRNKDARWASRAYEENWGKPEPSAAYFLALGQQGNPAATAPLLGIAANPAEPIMLRASALVVASRLPGTQRALSHSVHKAAADASALLRLAATQACAGLSGPEAVPVLSVLLKDAAFAVRVEAMRQLVTEVPAGERSGHESTLRRVAHEYEQAQHPFLDRAAVRLTLAGIVLGLGDSSAAEAHFRDALRLDENFVPAVVNYADFLRTQGRDPEGLELLERLLGRVPDAGPAWYARGLTLVRLKQPQAATSSLEKAQAQDPENSQYVLAHALALDSLGKTKEAIAALDQGISRTPWARSLHQARTQLLARDGDSPRLRSALQVWRERLPDDPEAQALASGLQ